MGGVGARQALPLQEGKEGKVLAMLKWGGAYNYVR